MKTVTKAFFRYLPRRKGLSALQLLGIACGVAAAVGMALSARAALASFGRAVGFLEGRATHALERPVGPVEEEALPRLAEDPAVEAFAPTLDRRIQLGGETVRLLGVDPFLDRHLRPELVPAGAVREKGLAFLFDPRGVFLSSGLAERLHAAAGATLPTPRGELHVLGTFPNPSGEPLAVMDIAHAQELFGLRGRVDRVDLVLSDEEGFRSRWGTGYRLVSNRQRQAVLRDLLSSFRLNLEALSLLGLFVGVFLVYNTATFAVVSRRRDAGILRSLGASRAEVAGAFLLEVASLGAAGGAAGGVLAYGLSLVLTSLVGSTISQLYSFLHAEPPPWSWWIPAAGAGLGLVTALLGAAFPLVDLLRADPVAALTGRAPPRRSRAAASAVAGLASALAACAVLAAVRHVYAGFAGAFGLLLATALASGLFLRLLYPLLLRLFGLAAGLTGRVAAGSIVRNLGRTSVAVAAFTVALSMSLGLGLMIGSFRETLVWWMDSQLTGDLYVATSSDVEVPEAFYDEVRALPGIGAVDPYRNVQAFFRGKPIRISAVNPDALQRFAHFGWLRGGNENWDPVKRGEVIVSESFQRRFGVGPGGSVRLQGARGPETLRVAAVFYDYTTEHGLVMMSRDLYLKLYGDRTLDSIAVFIDDRDPRKAAVLADVRARAARRGLPVVDRKELHGNVLAVFESTFAATRTMRLLAVVVAFFGIAGALLTLYMERQRDFGIYRALGFSAAQVASMTLLEGLGMGLASLALATGAGTVLSLVLIRVINLQSFHWTLFFHPALGPYATAAAVAVLGSVGAAVYPVWRVCRTFPQLQLREE